MYCERDGGKDLSVVQTFKPHIIGKLIDQKGLTWDIM